MSLLRKAQIGCLFIFGAGYFGSALAQVNSSALKGMVTDPSEAAVSGAKVTIMVPATGVRRSVLTNTDGTYYVSDLLPGLYTIAIEARGFKKATVQGVRLFVGQVVTQDLQLEVGATTQSVTVTASSPLLNTNDGQVGTVIQGQLLTEIPLNGRNFVQLNLLSPGVVRHKNGSVFDEDVDKTNEAFNVNGQRAQNNEFLLDGVSIKEHMNLGINILSPNPDALQEFQATTSNYSAAFGSEAAGQINLVTKSGTNRIRGGVYEFFRNNVLDARDFFEPGSSAPPYKRNQFGGNLGGPVHLPKIYNGRDRTFFFVSEESLREIKNAPLTGNFPTPAQVQGDLSALATPANPVIDPFTGDPFPGNIIPQDRMPSTLPSFLEKGLGKGPWLPVPNATAPGANFTKDPRRDVNWDQAITRIDHSISDKTMIYGRYAYYRIDSINPELNNNWDYTDSYHNSTAAGHLVESFSPTFVMDFAVGYSPFDYKEIESTNFKNNIVNDVLHIQGLSTRPSSWGAPIWNVSGFSAFGMSCFCPRAFSSKGLEFVPAFTLAKAKHNIRFGGMLRRHIEDFPESIFPNGNQSFDGRFSGYPLGDFLLGLPASAAVSTDLFKPELRYSQYSLYVQDDWKATPNLVLNFGVRYDWQGVPFSNNRSVANLYLGPNNASPQLVVSPGARGISFEGQTQQLYHFVPYVTADKAGLPDQLMKNDFGGWAPRFGFAYKVPHLKGMVVRGGYGIFSQRDVNEKYVEAAIQPPFIANFSKTLDQSNFTSFDWFNPFSGTLSSSVFQFWANGIDNKQFARMQAWNLTVEKSVGANLISAAYVANKVNHLPSFFVPNQARPGPGPFESRRRWPDWGVIFGTTTEGNSTYESGQFRFQRPLTGGLSMIVGYTWSKALDDSSGTWMGDGDRGPTMQDYYNLRLNKGLSSMDIRHRFVMSYVYNLPLGKSKRYLNKGGAAGAILGNWEVTGITTFSSGSPLTVLQVFDGANTDVGQNHADLVGDWHLSGSRSTGEKVEEWFNTAAFAENRPADLVNGPYRVGTSGRHIVIGPGVNSWDLGIFREFPFTESVKLQFRTEFFNLLNTPNFAQPLSTLGAAGFGSITSTASPPREIQFGLKLYF